MSAKTVADYMLEAEEQEREHNALFGELEIPRYTNRQLQAQWVQSKDSSSITGTTGWTAGAPREVLDRLNVGDPYILETRGFSLITGWLINGAWYGRKSDQDLDREHEAFVKDSRRRSQEYADAHREEWADREARLPEWIAQRIRAFHENNPGFEAEPMGWGYELIVCELAVLYAAMGEAILDKRVSSLGHNDEIDTYAREHGTSGNQHDVALALARNHIRRLVTADMAHRSSDDPS